jgi:hypothetical protein
LRSEGRISEQFEVFFNSLTLEEVIALKLELSVKTQGSPIYGLPLIENLKHIVQDAVLKFAISTTQTSSEAARLLGIKQINLYPLEKRFGIFGYFGKHLKMYSKWRQNTSKNKNETPT